MDVRDLRFYGRAFSDAEGSWPDALRARLRREGKAVVMARLGFGDKLRFLWRFPATLRRMRRVDLSAIRARGMDNEPFLRQQVEYIALFSTLAELRGLDEAISICKAIMEVDVSKQALALCLPEADRLAAFDDPHAAMRAWLDPVPDAARAAGCHDLEVVDLEPGVFGMNVSWCVWLELARTLGVPDACLPNCYADDLVFPAYFDALGIRYSRSQTLAGGGRCCDFRFERIGSPVAGASLPGDAEVRGERGGDADDG